MCSLEHDTCANMFSSGLHKRQQSKKKKNTRVKKAQPPIRRETRCNLQCIILCNFLFASSRRSFCEKGGSLKNSKKVQHCFLSCRLWMKVIFPILEVLAHQTHAHLQPNSAQTRRSCHSGYRKSYSRPAGRRATSAGLTSMDIFPPMCAAVNL